jgi:mannose-6-phosphate isomerase-like protein (cupin superfamily)
MATHDESLVVGPGGGKALAGSARTPLLLKATAEQARGAYALMEVNMPPGVPGPAPHVHLTHEEAMYVVEGELVIQLEDRQIPAPAGSFVLVPRGTAHTLWNAGALPAKLLAICSPPGLERFFEELAALRQASSSGQVDFDTIVALGRKHDTEFRPTPS